MTAREKIKNTIGASGVTGSSLVGARLIASQAGTLMDAPGS